MEAYKQRILKSHKINSFVACTLINDPEIKQSNVIVNNSYIDPSNTNGLFMMNSTYLYTNPPPYGYGTPAPYVAETVSRAYSFVKDHKEDAETTIAGYPVINAAVSKIDEYPRNGITGTFHPKTVEIFTKKFLSEFHDMTK